MTGLGVWALGGCRLFGSGSNDKVAAQRGGSARHASVDRSEELAAKAEAKRLAALSREERKSR